MGTLVCTVELSKTGGVTVTVDNSDDSITQTIAMDGTTLTLTVKDSSNTSTITQKADSIAISCKTFSVDAETITCTSEKATKHTSSGDVIELESAKDMKFTSSAKLVQSATGDVEISGSNFQATGQSQATMEAMTAKVSGTQGLTLEGTSQAELSGSMVTVKANATLSAESSGIATFKGSMTNIEGSLIKAG